MYPKSVGGLAVTHVRQARTNKVALSVSDDPDEVSAIRGVAELTLADGSKTFGCTSCADYTNDSVRAVVSHMGGKHPGESVRSPGEGRSVVANGVTLRDAIRAVSQVKRLSIRLVVVRQENAALKRRALAAEAELKAMAPAE
jgi:hypothetical protein